MKSGLAQKIAKQVAREGHEIVKTAANQITGAEKPASSENSVTPKTSGEESQLVKHQVELQDKIKSGRKLEAYQRELEDIHRQTIFKELQYKISQGFEVPLENYSELIPEQKQVLKAQAEAVKTQESKILDHEPALQIPGSKKGRRFGGGQKQAAEKQQTRVEKPVPPSG